VRSVYVWGLGELAQLTEVLLAMQREDRRIKNQRVRQEQALLEAFDLETDAMERAVNTMTDAALIAAGFHQHKRQWRKRRA
jgi:hypothetical protein